MSTLLKHPFKLCFNKETRIRLNLVCLSGIRDEQAFNTVTFYPSYVNKEEDKNELKMLMDSDDRFTDVSDYSHWGVEIIMLL